MARLNALHAARVLPMMTRSFSGVNKMRLFRYRMFFDEDDDNDDDGDNDW